MMSFLVGNALPRLFFMYLTFLQKSLIKKGALSRWKEPLTPRTYSGALLGVLAVGKQSAGLLQPLLSMDEEDKKLFQAFFFSFIFSKGYEGKGIAEGVRYGLYIGIWMSVGMAYATYAMIAIPYSLALQWFVYGVIEYVIYGIALALVFRKKPQTVAS